MYPILYFELMHTFVAISKKKCHRNLLSRLVNAHQAYLIINDDKKWHFLKEEIDYPIEKCELHSNTKINSKK